MRKVFVELHMDRILPEVDHQGSGMVTVRLGPNLDYEAIHGLLGEALSEEEWIEFQLIWSSDDAANLTFELLDHGTLLIHR